MLFGEFILALLLAVLLTAILVGPLGRSGPGPWAGVLFFLALTFLFTWAGGVWLRPIGPAAWGVSWIGFLIVALLVGLMLAVLSPLRHRPPPPNPSEGVARGGEAATAAVALAGILFWILLVLLGAAVIIGYVSQISR